jgi:parallel beta-helix repeat protein
LKEIAMFIDARLHSSVKRMALIFLLTLTCINVQAQNGLPENMLGYAGSFEISDVGVTNRCTNPNNLSGSCACPGSTQAAYSFRVINDAGANAKPHGAVIKICSAGSSAATVEFAGAYQVDDPVAAGRGCRVKNALTDSCACPSGSVARPWRVLVDGANGLMGSTINTCMRPRVDPVAFAGTYQVDTPVAGGLQCRHPNPFTAACSCPGGFNAQSHKVLADTSAGLNSSTLYSCTPPVAALHLCPGLLPNSDADLADPTGAIPAHEALQNCLNAQPIGGVFEIPAGQYRVDKQLLVSGSKTLRTQGTVNETQSCLGKLPCATFFAGLELQAIGGMLAANGTSGVHFANIVLDGDRIARMSTRAYKQCKAGKAGVQFGLNAVARPCKGCSFKYSASINTLCGTALDWRGDDAVIQHSIFSGNGDHFDTRAWADGLTLLESNNAVVTNNQFIDNSDIGFIFGGGTNSVVKNNLVRQSGMRAFAGMMLDNFNGGTSGNFTGAVISGNNVQCAQNKCLYSVNLGPHAWYQSRNIFGGSVVDNVFTGGVIALNVDGAGTDADPIFISGNTLATEKNPVIPNTPPCRKLQSTLFSISTDSRLRGDSTKPTLTQDVHGCVGQTQW